MLSKSCLVLSLCFLATSTLVSAGSDGYCRAAVFQGAGDIVSYEAGVFRGLVDNLPANEVAYDVVGGTGFGVINMFFLTTSSIGNETGAALAMKEFWETVDYKDFYDDWLLGITEGLFFEPGLYNTENYIKTMTKLLTGSEAYRELNMVAVDANTGELIRFDESTVDADLAELWVASSSYPGVFPYINFDNMTLVDASVMNSLDIGGAITRCRESGYADDKIIVDLFLTNSASSSVVNCTDYSAFDMIGRLIEVYTYSFQISDLYHSLADYTDVNFRYIIAPSERPYYNIFPYDFKDKDMIAAMDLGYQDAVNCISTGSSCRTTAFLEAEQKMEEKNPGRVKKDTSHVHRDYPKKVEGL